MFFPDGVSPLNELKSPYDVIELHVFSLHETQIDRSLLRIIGVAAGECLHNVYRIIMTALGQREDRTRLVFHCWVLADGRVAGTTIRNKDLAKSFVIDRQVFLKDLPLCLEYSLILVFGKCVYLVVVKDIFSGFTSEQDLIWLPRVCEGSYGEAVPLDLCYYPHLFVSDNSDTNFENIHLKPKFNTNNYLTNEELDEINCQFSKMRFIRQKSQLKPVLRKCRPEALINDEATRKQCFRMSPRRFYYYFWIQRLLTQAIYLNQQAPVPFTQPPVVPMSPNASHLQAINLPLPEQNLVLPAMMIPHVEPPMESSPDVVNILNQLPPIDPSINYNEPLWLLDAASQPIVRPMGRTGQFFPRCRVSKRIELSPSFQPNDDITKSFNNDLFSYNQDSSTVDLTDNQILTNAPNDNQL